MLYTKIVTASLESQYTLYCDFFNVVYEIVCSTGTGEGGRKMMWLLYLSTSRIMLCKYISVIFLTKIEFPRLFYNDFQLFLSVKKQFFATGIKKKKKFLVYGFSNI